jgi:molybdopterin/thiamine biosynthesis adenylyltransferase
VPIEFTWTKSKARCHPGEHVRIGRIGELAVWHVYDDTARSLYEAAVFGHHCTHRFTTIDEAKAWCERAGKSFVEEAMRDLGIKL